MFIPSSFLLCAREPGARTQQVPPLDAGLKLASWRVYSTRCAHSTGGAAKV
jgi:hypothetical protein